MQTFLRLLFLTIALVVSWAGFASSQESSPLGYSKNTIRSDHREISNPLIAPASEIRLTSGNTRAQSNSEVSLRIETSSPVVLLDDLFDLDIVLEAGENEITGVQAFIEFDPAVFEVQDVDESRPGVQITNGDILPQVLVNSADNAQGQIDYSASTLGEPFPSGNILIATITFRAIGTTSNAGSEVAFINKFPNETIIGDSNGDPVEAPLLGVSIIVAEGIQADLSLTKSVSDATPGPDADISYFLTVVNEGPFGAQNLVITDALPPEAVFLSADGCSYDPQSHVVRCDIAELARGGDTVRTIEVSLSAAVDEVITNEAEVTSDIFDPNTSNNLSEASAVVGGICGDLNSDTLVNIFDTIIGLKILAGILQLEDRQNVLGDLNNSHGLDVGDAVIGLQNIVRDTLPESCGPEPTEQ